MFGGQPLVRWRAEGDQTAALAQQAVGALQHRAADRIDDHVEPGLHLGQIPGVGADEAFRAEAPHEVGVPAAAVAVTWPPRIAASWTAKMPTPPAPPWTSTRSPGSSAA